MKDDTFFAWYELINDILFLLGNKIGLRFHLRFYFVHFLSRLRATLYTIVSAGRSSVRRTFLSRATRPISHCVGPSVRRSFTLHFFLHF